MENPPQYFAVPGSTMSMSQFVSAVLDRSEAGLLLDLTHFLITALNTGVDPVADLERLPLERVVEVHISGMSCQSGVYWDDHSMLAPPEIFDLLARTLRRARPRAVTFRIQLGAAPAIATGRGANGPGARAPGGRMKAALVHSLLAAGLVKPNLLRTWGEAPAALSRSDLPPEPFDLQALRQFA
ncbi:DUF692 domain-containing protein [Massilia sp. H-1]|nr:DUF692 domain-containing protein [Massilia sp. H-1]